MITGAITPEDHIAALRLHRAKAEKVERVVLAIFATTGAVILATGPLFPGALLLGAGVGGLAGQLVVSKAILPRRARKIHRQQASLRATYTYEWDERGIRVSSESAQGSRPWSDYIRMRENDHLLLLYHSDAMFELIPKSWFGSPAQLQEFTALARAGLRP